MRGKHVCNQSSREKSNSVIDRRSQTREARQGISGSRCAGLDRLPTFCYGAHGRMVTSAIDWCGKMSIPTSDTHIHIISYSPPTLPWVGMDYGGKPHLPRGSNMVSYHFPGPASAAHSRPHLYTPVQWSRWQTPSVEPHTVLALPHCLTFPYLYTAGIVPYLIILYAGSGHMCCVQGG